MIIQNKLYEVLMQLSTVEILYRFIGTDTLPNSLVRT